MELHLQRAGEKKIHWESSPQAEDKSNILRFDASLPNAITALVKVVILIWGRGEQEMFRPCSDKTLKENLPSNVGGNLTSLQKGFFYFLNERKESFCCLQEWIFSRGMGQERDKSAWQNGNLGLLKTFPLVLTCFLTLVPGRECSGRKGESTELD